MILLELVLLFHVVPALLALAGLGIVSIVTK